MCTTDHYHLQAKPLKVFQKYKQNMKGSAKYVQKERIQRRLFQAARGRRKESWKSSTPMSSSSSNGYVYYASFIDDYYRKTRIHFFLKRKDEVFSNFKEFKSLIENHTNMKTKNFRSDNGVEFTSDEFKELCKESGIERELNIPYNPQ